MSAVNKGSIFRFLTKPWDDDELKITIEDGFKRHQEIFCERLKRESLQQGNNELGKANSGLQAVKDDLENK